MHRDTLTSNGLDSYRRDIVDVQRLRAEAHVLKAYYYFELAKRYGGGTPHRPRVCRPEGGQPSARHVRRGGRPHPARDRRGAQRTGRRLAGREPRGEVGPDHPRRGAGPQVEGVALCRQPAVQSLGRKVQVGCRCRCGLRSDQHGHLFPASRLRRAVRRRNLYDQPRDHLGGAYGGDQRVRTQELPHRHAGRRYGYLPFAEPRGSL